MFNQVKENDFWFELPGGVRNQGFKNSNFTVNNEELKEVYESTVRHLTLE